MRASDRVVSKNSASPNAERSWALAHPAVSKKIDIWNTRMAVILMVIGIFDDRNDVHLKIIDN